MGRPKLHDHCTVDGCQRPHKAGGYCASHYQQLWRKEEPRQIQERRYDYNGTCSAEGCDKPERSKGFCNTHYMRWFRHGAADFRYKAGRGVEIAEPKVTS